jgi:hypothetical protein
MKRVLFGLAAAALMTLGAGLSSASASTITVDPAPTDSFHVGNLFPSFGGFDDPYQFTLTHNADLTSSIASNNLVFAVAVVDASNNLVSLTNLVAGVLYTLHVAGFSGNFGGYGGTVTFTAVAATTPIPPALLLFTTTLAGFGAFAYRRRRTQPFA